MQWFPIQLGRGFVFKAAIYCCLCCHVSAQSFAEDYATTESRVPMVTAPSSSWDGPLAVHVSEGLPEVGFGAERFFFDGAVEPAQLQRQIMAPTTVSPLIGRASRPVSIVAMAQRQSRINLASLASLSLNVRGIDAKLTQSTDLGGLFRKSASAIGVKGVRRQPIIHDPRIRDHKGAQTNDAGSYWVPARMDLDTAVSKIDSRLIQNVVAIKGPYSSLYGPGFSFIDFQLKASPRFNGYQTHGETSIDYQTNGEQWHGRQTVLGGDSDSGFRLSYGHRTGSDYESGDGTLLPSSYKSRDLTFAYGIDLSPYRRLEFSALRLDQTDLELSGQAFDIDYLVTDAYELEYTNDMGSFSDRFELSTWYNRTELAGSAQRAGKQRQFPVYDSIDFVGNTDVDSMSTGYTAGWTWGDQWRNLTFGTDLRYVKQELNEITSGDTGTQFWRDRNSPIPRSHQSNPGLFAQHSQKLTQNIELSAGARLDFVSSDIDDDSAKLTDVGARPVLADELSLGEILGTNDFDQDFTLASVFFLADLQVTQFWKATLGYGYAERAPNLTELYAAEPFMFLLQNGLNSVTGNPDLEKERLWQLDVGLDYEDGRLRGGINGFHAWIRDYITFENLETFTLGGITEQTNLRFVNTDLATLAGGELYAEYDASAWISMFGTMSYVEGRDRSRNGDFATQEPVFNSTMDSTGLTQVAGQPRGSFSGVAGADKEPLPNIGPLDARVGIRLHQAGRDPNWGVELSARIVDNQDRVATSLLESETPGFTIWDVRGYFRPRRGVLMVAGVENFTDKQYREYLDFRPQNAGALTVYQPGVNFYFGTELTY